MTSTSTFVPAGMILPYSGEVVMFRNTADLASLRLSFGSRVSKPCSPIRSSDSLSKSPFRQPVKEMSELTIV